MRGLCRAVFFTGLLACGLAAGGAPAAAYQEADVAGDGEVALQDLLADPEAYTDAPVVVRGELVGDFGRRADGSVWTQLNDDPYAAAPLREGGSLAGPNVGIGVRIPEGVWPELDQPGGYRVRGPLVRLTGWWRFHDPERGGESYLEVTALELLAPPRALHEEMRWLPLGLGLGFLGAAAAVGWAVRRRASR